MNGKAMKFRIPLYKRVFYKGKRFVYNLIEMAAYALGATFAIAGSVVLLAMGYCLGLIWKYGWALIIAAAIVGAAYVMK